MPQGKSKRLHSSLVGINLDRSSIISALIVVKVKVSHILTLSLDQCSSSGVSVVMLSVVDY